MSLRGMDAGLTGMIASTDQLSVISNNVANVNTNAFKRDDVSFADIFYQVLIPYNKRSRPPIPMGVQLGVGVTVSGTPTDFSQGPFVPGLTLDVAIDGEGFFRVVDSNGKFFYTRLGAFEPKTDGAAGNLNLQLGNRSVFVSPAVTLRGIPGDITVSPDGVVIQGGVPVGQFQLFTFRNPQGLSQAGDLLFEESPASGPAVAGIPGQNGRGLLVDQALEGSNVELVSELVDLLEAGRSFEFSSQSFSTGNQELETTIALAQTAA